MERNKASYQRLCKGLEKDYENCEKGARKITPDIAELTFRGHSEDTAQARIQCLLTHPLP